jgi:hypothetical protein
MIEAKSPDDVDTGSTNIDQGERLRYLNWASLVVVLVTLGLALGATMYYVLAAHETDVIWASALMLVSSVLILFGALSLIQVEIRPSLLMIAIGVSEIFKNLLWIFYVASLDHPRVLSHATAFSGSALFLAIVMVVAVFQLTAWVLRYASDGEKRIDVHDDQATKAHEGFSGSGKLVVEQLLENRLHAACGLIVAFLHVAYFMSFAIAFNDLLHDHKTLRRTVPRLTAPPELAPATNDPTSAVRSDELKRVYWFTFSKNSASLACTKNINMRHFPKESPLWDAQTSRDQRLEALQLSGDCRDEYERIWWNLVQLRDLREHLRDTLNADAYAGYRFEVVAHATEPSPKGDFSSNYELSLARAQQVKYLLENLISEEDEYQDSHGAAVNAEWILVPVGSGHLALIADSKKVSDAMKAQGVDAKLAAEFKVTRVPPSLASRHRKWLDDVSNAGAGNLLDYLYFMIYTITTTGNGDLIPAAGYVQFAAALASIFEVFFIVVVFNVVLALRKNSAQLA